MSQFMAGVKNSSNCVDDRSHVFIQYTCIQSDARLKLKTFYLWVIVGTVIFSSYFFAFEIERLALKKI